MTFRFKRSTRTAAYFVYDVSEKLIGSVWPKERWTVRGKSKYWVAHSNGRNIGIGSTRNEAAKLLIKPGN